MSNLTVIEIGPRPPFATPAQIWAEVKTAAQAGGRGHWEFHGPKTGAADMPTFYWHGRAANAYEVRYKDWQEWLRVAAVTAGIDLEKED